VTHICCVITGSDSQTMKSRRSQDADSLWKQIKRCRFDVYTVLGLNAFDMEFEGWLFRITCC